MPLPVLASLRAQGLIVTCGTRQLRGNCWKYAVLCAGALYYLVDSSFPVWQGIPTSEHVYLLCVFLCVLLDVQRINLREWNFPVAHELINLCLYIQLHWTSYSVGTVFSSSSLCFYCLGFFFSTALLYKPVDRVTRSTLVLHVSIQKVVFKL